MNKAKSTPQKSKQVKKQVPKEWKDRISIEDYQGLRDCFLIFDQDGSGTIDPQEIVKVLQELGLDKRNPYVIKIVWALREKNKILNFQQFVDVVCSQIGQYKTKDGLKRIWKLYDKQQNEVIGFAQLKQIARFIGESMTDDDIMELMHSTFISHKTQSNQGFNFDQFYLVISNYNKRFNRQI